ncbi:periplasmic heavy metal sensor [Roseovarius autotrophicus]|uniref:periplasmic heavy metal sensor n=1 Tax=Roseovarius autotrophicus TaxID=2824121 RepID=UPI0019E5D53E|nr:periplasmic heavy metal sensor [Roseovarius autotrophicus]MBE0452517.1 periplasmic heavy metal sensor [Roseovarius sp.]
MAEGKKGGLSTGLRTFLVVSVALNLLVAGAAAGWWLRHGDGYHGHHPARLDMVGGPLSRALSEADRREIARGMRAHMRVQGPERGAMRASMEALVAELRAEPFDAGKVALRLAAQRAAFAERFEMGQAVLVAHFAAMTGADRAAYADRLEAELAAYSGRRRE